MTPYKKRLLQWCVCGALFGAVMSWLTFSGGHTSHHTIEIWRIPLAEIFMFPPGYILEAFGVHAIQSRLGGDIQFGFVNSIIWAILAALAFFVKTAAGKNK